MFAQYATTFKTQCFCFPFFHIIIHLYVKIQSERLGQKANKCFEMSVDWYYDDVQTFSVIFKIVYK